MKPSLSPFQNRPIAPSIRHSFIKGLGKGRGFENRREQQATSNKQQATLNFQLSTRIVT